MFVCVFLSFLASSIPLGLAKSNAMFMYYGSTLDAIENYILKYEGSSLKKEKALGAGDRMV